MKSNIFARSIIIAGVAVLFIFSDTAQAYWVWTPGTKKFINPKMAVKDTPKEQFEWGMSFYNAKDYQRAATEFDKLTKQYEYSEYASRAQYYAGLCYENMNKFYIAFQNYQKAIDNFPHIENMDEIVAREFNIANMFAAKESPKVLGTDILTSLDRAIEIYKKVVDNAPYGRLADEAQFNMAMAMKKAERYDEAIQAFQKILDDYSTSTFVDKSKFEVADCAYKASLKPAYDSEPTARAIKAFEDFTHENRDRALSREADKTIQRLRDKAAEKSLLTARFYEKLGRYQAAVIYYKDVITSYPDSSFVNLARSKVESLTAKLEKPKTKMAPLSFFKPAKPKEAVSEEKAPKGKGWAPFSFMKLAKPAETSAPAAAPIAEEAQKSKGWKPFNFTQPAAKPAEIPVSTETPKGKGWMPLSFTKVSKPKAAAPEAVQETGAAKRKGWTPFNFTKPSKPREVAKEEKAPKSKGWTPFSFMKPKKTVGEKEVTEAKVGGPAVTTGVLNVPPAVIQKELKLESATEEATESEKPSEIRVTTDEAEVKTSQEVKTSREAPVEKSEDEKLEDQIEKSEY